MRPINLSASSAKDYYFEKDPLFSDKEGGNFNWFGLGAEALKLSGNITKQELSNILEGKDKNSVQLIESGGNTNKRAALDLPLTAPKSVSHMALVMADEKLVKAHEDAVKATLDYIEKNYAYTRNYVKDENGKIKRDSDGLKIREKTQTNNLVIGTALHSISRPVGGQVSDPQLHSHNLIMNITYDSQTGKFKALSNEKIFENQKLITQIYQSELAKNTKELGYAIEQKSNGFWEISGYKKETLEQFSKRNLEIDEKSKESNYSKNDIQHFSKSEKQDIDKKTLINDWKIQTESKQNSLLEDIKKASADFEDKKITTDNVLKVVADVMTRQESVLSKNEISIMALQVSRGIFTISDIEKYLENIKENGQKESNDLKKIVDDKGNVFYTTKYISDLEKENIDIMKNQQKFKGLMSEEEALKGLQNYEELKGFQMTEGQKNASLKILTGDSQYLNVQGDAGVGKTTMLDAIRHAISFHSIEKGSETEVLLGVVAPSGKAAIGAQIESGIEGSTVDRFFIEGGKFQSEKNKKTDFTKTETETEINVEKISEKKEIQSDYKKVDTAEFSKKVHEFLDTPKDFKDFKTSIKSSVIEKIKNDSEFSREKNLNPSLVSVKDKKTGEEYLKYDDSWKKTIRSNNSLVSLKGKNLLRTEEFKGNINHFFSPTEFVSSKRVEVSTGKWKGSFEITEKKTIGDTKTTHKETHLNDGRVIKSDTTNWNPFRSSHFGGFSKGVKVPLSIKPLSYSGFVSTTFYNKSSIHTEGKQFNSLLFSVGKIDGVGINKEFYNKDRNFSILGGTILKKESGLRITQNSKNSYDKFGMFGISSTKIDKEKYTSKKYGKNHLLSNEKSVIKNYFGYKIETSQKKELIQDRISTQTKFRAFPFSIRHIEEFYQKTDSLEKQVKEINLFGGLVSYKKDFDKLNRGEGIGKSFSSFYGLLSKSNKSISEKREDGTIFKREIDTSNKLGFRVIKSTETLYDKDGNEKSVTHKETHKFLGLKISENSGKSGEEFKSIELGVLKKISDDGTYKRLDYTKENNSVSYKESEKKVDEESIKKLSDSLKNVEIDKKTKVIFVDEASMLGSKKANELLKMGQDNGYRIVFMGDEKQLSSIDSGRFFKQSKTVLETVQVDESLRQKNDFTKSVVGSMSKKEIQKSFKELSAHGKFLEIVDKKEQVELVARAISSNYKETLGVVSKVSESKEINLKVRQLLGFKGENYEIYKPLNFTNYKKMTADSYEKGYVLTLKEKDDKDKIKMERFVIEDKDNKNNKLTLVSEKTGEKKDFDVRKDFDSITTIERKELREFAEGDKIMAVRNDKKNNLMNGEIGIIEKIDDNKFIINFGSEKSPDLKTVDVSKYKSLEYSYSITTHKSQGMTTDKVVALFNSENRDMNNHNMMYVAESRTKNDLTVITDSKEELLKSLKNEDSKTSTLDYEKDYEKYTSKNDKFFNQDKHDIDTKQKSDEFKEIDYKKIDEKIEELSNKIDVSYKDGRYKDFDKDFINKIKLELIKNNGLDVKKMETSYDKLVFDKGYTKEEIEESKKFILDTVKDLEKQGVLTKEEITEKKYKVEDGKVIEDKDKKPAVVGVKYNFVDSNLALEKEFSSKERLYNSIKFDDTKDEKLDNGFKKSEINVKKTDKTEENFKNNEKTEKIKQSFYNI